MARPQEISEEDVLETLANWPEPVAKASEVGEELDVSPRTARRRLKKLDQKGVVESKSLGKPTVWWVVREEEKTQKTEKYHEDGEEEPEIVSDGLGLPQHILELVTIFGLVMGVASLFAPLVVFLFDLLTPLIFSGTFLAKVEPVPGRIIPEWPLVFFALAITAKLAIDLELIRQAEIKICEFRNSIN